MGNVAWMHFRDELISINIGAKSIGDVIFLFQFTDSWVIIIICVQNLDGTVYFVEEF